MADSKVTVWHTDAGCRQVLPLRTMTTISELEATLEAGGIQE